MGRQQRSSLLPFHRGQDCQIQRQGKPSSKIPFAHRPPNHFPTILPLVSSSMQILIFRCAFGNSGQHHFHRSTTDIGILHSKCSLRAFSNLQIFLEPEGRNTPELYVQGFSTGLPERLQLALLHTLPGLHSPFKLCHWPFVSNPQGKPTYYPCSQENFS